jgi:hypothetical protein
MQAASSARSVKPHTWYVLEESAHGLEGSKILPIWALEGRSKCEMQQSQETSLSYWLWVSREGQ